MKEQIKISTLSFLIILLSTNVAMAIDLLLLYVWGGWYDPNRFIEITELVVLAILILASLIGIFKLSAMKLLDKGQ